MTGHGSQCLRKSEPNKILRESPKRIFICDRLRNGAGIVFRAASCLRPGTASLTRHALRSTMRELSAEAACTMHAQTISGRTIVRIQKFALYSAFALIAPSCSARSRFTRSESKIAV